jgi:hypothetical protein
MSLDEEYQIVQRPAKVLRNLQVIDRFPLDAILQTAKTGSAIKLSLPPRPEKKKDHLEERYRMLGLLRGLLTRRGYALEWSQDPESREHVLVWAVLMVDEEDAG